METPVRPTNNNQFVALQWVLCPGVFRDVIVKQKQISVSNTPVTSVRVNINETLHGTGRKEDILPTTEELRIDVHN
jgi:hypothetical protein